MDDRADETTDEPDVAGRSDGPATERPEQPETAPIAEADLPGRGTE